jgi:capsular polysaccharide biosynthesis protein
LISVQAHHPELHLIYPEVWNEIPFVRESLSLFPKLRREVVPPHYHLKVPHLIMPEVKPWTPMFIPEQTTQVRSLLLNLANSIPATARKKVYISRKKAARKKFQDEAGAEAYFSDKGFDAVYMEELSFKEQIALARDAEEMIAITGAGTINALFMKPNSVLMDLTNTAYLKKKQYKFHYFKLCNILKIKYAVLFCQAENNPTLKHYSMQNLILNTQNFDHLYTQIQRP